MRAATGRPANGRFSDGIKEAGDAHDFTSTECVHQSAPATIETNGSRTPRRKPVARVSQNRHRFSGEWCSASVRPWRCLSNTRRYDLSHSPQRTRPLSDHHSRDLAVWHRFWCPSYGCGPNVPSSIWRGLRLHAAGTPVRDRDVSGTGWQSPARVSGRPRPRCRKENTGLPGVVCCRSCPEVIADCSS